MWIVLNDSYLSIVAVEGEPSIKLVRARLQDDIKNVFPNAEVLVTEERDYLFRAYIPTKTVSEVIAKRINEIDYTNFKDSVKSSDYERKLAYSRIWGIMFDLQERLFARAPWYLNYRNW